MGVGPGNVQYNYAQLESIWVQAGGNAQYQAMAAAIAMAESGGNSAAYDDDTNGSVDRGLWQINSVHGSQSTFDVMGNARAAVAISNNGTNWSPWVTYQTGAYQRFLQGNVKPAPAPTNGTQAAQNNTNQTPQAATLESCGFWTWFIKPGSCAGQAIGGAVVGGTEAVAGQIIDGLIGGILNPIIQIVAGIMGMIGGGIMMGAGIYFIVKDNEKVQAGIGAGGDLISFFSSSSNNGNVTRPSRQSGDPQVVGGRAGPRQAQAKQAGINEQLAGEVSRYPIPVE